MEDDEIWWSSEKKRERKKEMEGKITVMIRKVERQLSLEVEKAVAVRPISVAPLDDAISKNALGQVEFYFSDGNLLSDKFLADSINESDEGLVSLALVCTFAGMRYHLGLGSVKADEVPENTVLAIAPSVEKLAAAQNLR